ncbi:MAG: hypothetical protein B6A08_10295 [Sorangiineae bacterium NIC37A_2]|jgi:hypothetical protein|nr:MAG: hypothetical protein B6A08_10295 [Sorangiineae bacterium NIC37A_2]
MEKSEGLVIGSYRLNGLLGSASSTYFAENVHTGELSVVKFFSGENVDQKFWRGISSAARAEVEKDERICHFAEVGFVDDEIYAAAPYLHGATIAQLIKALSRQRDLTLTPLHERTVAWIALELVRAAQVTLREPTLPASSDRNLVLPTEYFVLHSGLVRGLDRRWSWLETLTSGFPLGGHEASAAYRSPHVASAEAGQAFSILVMLWEMLVGYRLFRRNTLEETIDLIQEGTVPDPRTLNPRISKEMGVFVQKTLMARGGVKLSVIEAKLKRLAQMDGEAGVTAAQALMSTIFPDELVGISTKMQLSMLKKLEPEVPRSVGEPILPPNPLDAFLGGRDPMSQDDSTTCIVTPPIEELQRVAQLSWLEDEAAPRMRVVARKPKRKGKVQAGVILAALLVIFGFTLQAAVRSGGNTRMSEMSFNPLFGETPRATQMAADPVDAELAIEGEDVEALPMGGPREVAAEVPSDALPEPNLGEELGAIEVPSEVVPSQPQAQVALQKEPAVRTASPAYLPSAPVAEESVKEVPRATGDVLVNAPAGVKVWKDGQLLGTGRFSASLPFGEHTLKVESEGGGTSYFVTRVRPGVAAIVDIGN